MKKFLTLTVMAFMAITVLAEFDSKYHNGIRLYGNISNLTGSKNYKNAFGFAVGYTPQFDFNEKFYLQSGIDIVRYSHKHIFRRKELEYAPTATSLYINFPLHVGYYHILKNVSFLFVQAGPTLAVGIKGVDYYRYSSALFESRSYFETARRFDVLLGGRIGLNIKGFEISAGVNYGLIEVYKGSRSHNICFDLGVGVKIFSLR